MDKYKVRFKYFPKEVFIWEDSEFLREIRSDIEVNKFTLNTKKITRVEQEFWFDNEYSRNDNYHIYIVFDEKSKKPIGFLYYYPDSLVNRRMFFKYYLISESSDYISLHKQMLRFIINKSKTYDVPIHKLFTHILTNDDNKMYIMNKTLGFEVDGILSDFVYKDNEFRDVYVMSKLLTN